MTNDFAQREVAFLMGIGGIEIEYNKALGKDINLADLKAKYDAVFVGVGLGSTNDLGLKGEEFPGVDDAITFIEKLRQTEPKSDMPVGDKVVVIGGGNTAIDAAVQAKRIGAEEVTLVYRRGPGKHVSDRVRARSCENQWCRCALLGQAGGDQGQWQADGHGVRKDRT